MTDEAEPMEPADFVMLTKRFDDGKITLDLFSYMVRNPESFEVKRELDQMRRSMAISQKARLILGD
jgi:hypothetical protein